MERNENTSISSGVTDTSAISQRCNPGALYGGATYHRASRPIGAVLPTRNATMHKCATCGRAFTRRDHLRRHASGCRPKPFTCDVFHSGFTRKWDLDQHKRTVQCGGPPQPEPAPKRRRIALNEDPLSPPPIEQLDDELSSDLQDAVRDNWGVYAHMWPKDPCRRGITTG